MDAFTEKRIKMSNLEECIIKAHDGDRVRIKEADCDDQICVRRGWATKNGETIVCLPHKLVIEVRSTDGGDEDSLIY